MNVGFTEGTVELYNISIRKEVANKLAAIMYSGDTGTLTLTLSRKGSSVDVALCSFEEWYKVRILN